MLQVDLSTLSGRELRRLLDSTRARGQAAEAYQILQEMAARREQEGRRALLPIRRPAADPHVIEVDLGDPLERSEEPAEAAMAAPPEAQEEFAEADAEPAPVAADAAPSDLEADAFPQIVVEPPPLGPSRRSRWPGAGFVIGVALGVAVGWGAGDLARPRPSASAAPAAAAPSRAAIALQPPPAAPEPAAEPASTAAPEPPAAPVAASPDLAPEPEPPAPAMPAAGAGAAEAPAPAAEPVVRLAPEGCAAAPTPADRTICADPELRRLQRRLQLAYAEALEAHQDRALLRERQLAWRSARNTVADPDRLARLYEARIRKLRAATAAARGG